MRLTIGKPAPGEGYSKDEGGRMKDEDRDLTDTDSKTQSRIDFKRWIKRLGFWGLLFFLLKGLLWLTIPALIAIFATD